MKAKCITGVVLFIFNLARMQFCKIPEFIIELLIHTDLSPLKK